MESKQRRATGQPDGQKTWGVGGGSGGDETYNNVCPRPCASKRMQQKVMMVRKADCIGGAHEERVSQHTRASLLQTSL